MTVRPKIDLSKVPEEARDKAATALWTRRKTYLFRCERWSLRIDHRMHQGSLVGSSQYDIECTSLSGIWREADYDCSIQFAEGNSAVHSEAHPEHTCGFLRLHPPTTVDGERQKGAFAAYLMMPSERFWRLEPCLLHPDYLTMISLEIHDTLAEWTGEEVVACDHYDISFRKREAR
jgi:hypothetical protein